MTDFQSLTNIVVTYYDQHVKNLFQDFTQWFKTTDPIIISIAIALILSLYCLIGSLNTGDCSFVDRQWSIVPVLHTLLYSYFSNWNPRNVLMTVLASLWGMRLTFNFWRKGGYSGE